LTIHRKTEEKMSNLIYTVATERGKDHED